MTHQESVSQSGIENTERQSWLRFLSDFDAIQNAERVHDVDLQNIDRIDLSEEDAAVFEKLKNRTLTLEELEISRRAAIPDEVSPAEDFKRRRSRKHFYAWLANELQQMIYKVGKYKEVAS